MPRHPYQLDLYDPADAVRLTRPTPDEGADRLRQMVYRRTRGDLSALYEVAGRLEGWSSYEVSEWLRGERDVDDERVKLELLEYGSGR